MSTRRWSIFLSLEIILLTNLGVWRCLRSLLSISESVDSVYLRSRTFWSTTRWLICRIKYSYSGFNKASVAFSTSLIRCMNFCKSNSLSIKTWAARSVLSFFDARLQIDLSHYRKSGYLLCSSFSIDMKFFTISLVTYSLLEDGSAGSKSSLRASAFFLVRNFAIML